MQEIMEGRGRENAFVPTHGLKEFLYELKAMGVKNRPGDIRPLRESMA